jgi:FkbM family methyltransferase
MTRWWGRIADDVKIALRAYRAGASISSIALYPVRRRIRDRRHQIDLRGGLKLISPSEEPILPMFHRIWGRQVYVPSGYEIRPGDTVVDVGANVGVFTLWAASRSPGVAVIALEPSPTVCRYLQDNVSRNAAGNVTVYQAACGARTGKATLYVQGYETNNSLYPRDVWGSDYAPGYEVDVVTLDDVFALSGVTRCDLLKMNCEGGEYDALFGCTADALGRVQRVAMEYHIGRQERTPDEIADLLRHAGFTVELRPLHDGEGGYLYATRPEASP